MDLKELKKMVKDAIDNGATTVEQVHKSIAGMPFKYIEKIGPLEGSSKNIQEFQDKTIGNVYDFIRKMNQKVDDIASELLDKVDKDQGGQKKA